MRYRVVRRVIPPQSPSVDGSWASRSTGTGVTYASNFATSAEVTNFIHTQPGNITRDTTEGLSSGASMKFFIPASAGAAAGDWCHPLNSSWNTNGQGFQHQEFYIQYRIKLGPNWLRPSNNGGGRKTCIVSQMNLQDLPSSSSAVTFEIVNNNRLYRGVINTYHQDGNSFPDFDETIGADLRVQPAVDWGASFDNRHRYAYWEGTSSNTIVNMSPGCVRWVEGEWYTIYMRIKGNTYNGSAGNEFDQWVAGPSDSTYTQIYSARNFTLGADDHSQQGGGGFNAIWFLGYDTNRTSADYDTWFWIGEVIVSTQPIACPTPLVTIPTWITSQVDKTWSQPVSNTISSVWQTTTGGFDSTSHMAFSGAWAFDHATKRLITGYGGGHSDGDSNQVPYVDLAATAPVWALQRNPSTSQTRSGSDYSCVYSDGQPRSSHTFKHGVWSPGTQSYWITSQAGLYHDGFNGGRFFELARGSSSFTARGYYPGANATNGVTDTQTNGVSDYDPYTGQIWTMTAQGPCWTIDPVTYATSVKSNVNPINFTFSGAIAPERRCFLIYKPADGSVRTYDLDTDTYNTPTISGTGPTGVNSVGLVWHSPSGAFLAWGHSTNRDKIYKLKPPDVFSFTGTWTWSQINADASNSITPPNVGTYGNAKDLIHGKFALCKDFGGLRSDIVALTLRTDGPVSVYKLPKGGV